LSNGNEKVQLIAMSVHANSNHRDLFVAACIAALVSGLWFLVAWRYGFDMADEGYYWYGAQRVLFGEVPMRDFAAYDVGRYYWAAGIMHLISDDGAFGARVAAVLFQTIGTTLGTFLALRSCHPTDAARWPLSVLAAAILTLWVWPYYKAFDHAASVLIVAVLATMIRHPNTLTWMVSGICLGLAAVIGRNHGLYGAIALSFVILVLLIQAQKRRDVIRLTAFFIAGVVVGFSPIFFMMMAIDGFSATFIDSIIKLVRAGKTNIELPVPWPWTSDYTGLGIALTANQIAARSGFIFLLMFPFVGLVVLASRRFNLGSDWSKVLLAAVATAIPYAHYAFSRADITHLALAIFPPIIGVLALGAGLGGMRSLITASVVLGVSVTAISDSQPFLSATLLKRPWVETDVGERRLFMRKGQHYQLFQTATAVLATRTGGPRRFLAVPNMTSLYSIYRAKMPLWDIYVLHPRDGAFENAEIERLIAFAPEIVLVSDHALDGNETARFSRLRPLVSQTIVSRYRRTDLGERFGDPKLEVYISP
jgi:hypothetical protein